MTVLELPAFCTPLLGDVFGRDAQDFGPPELARTLAVVRSISRGPQSVQCCPQWAVQQFVKFGKFPRCDFDSRNS